MPEEGGLQHRSAAELKEQLEAERRGLPFLLYRDGDARQRIIWLTGKDRLTLGRAPDTDVPLTWDQHVSRVHAELTLAGRDWIVDDDGLSRNGTWVNGERLTRRRRLEDGDVLRMGGTHLRVRLPEPVDYGRTAPEMSDPPEATLSPAQRRVLVALCRPLAAGSPEATPATNRQIAEELYLSIEAVKTHLRLLFAKFGVEDMEQNQKRHALAARALSSGAVTPDDLRRSADGVA